MLKALVSGGGLAGLCAAISLRRAGHIVHVYERSCKNNEIGAAINVPPNALRFLTAWGLDPVKWRFVKSRGVTFQDPFTMKTIAQASNERTAIEVGGTDLYYAHRVDLHNSLKWMATREDGPGTPVAIHQSSKVVGYVSQDWMRCGCFESPTYTYLVGSLGPVYYSGQWGNHLWRRGHRRRRRPFDCLRCCNRLQERASCPRTL